MTKKPLNPQVQTYCLAVITVAVLTYMVYWLRPVLVPFVVALFVVSGITPILETVERYLGVNRLIASVIAFVFGIFVLGLLTICLWGSAQQLASQGVAYRARVSDLLEKAQNWVPESILPANLRFGFREKEAEGEVAGDESEDSGETGDSEVDGSKVESSDRADEQSVEPETPPGAEADTNSGKDSLAAQGSTDGLPVESFPDSSFAPLPTGAGDSDTQAAVASEIESFRQAIDSLIRQGLAHLSSTLLEFFSTSVVVLIYVFFLILGSADSARMNSSMKAVDQQVRSYLFLKTVISIFTGVAFGVALWAFGVPMALTFGLLAFLLNYIPNVGPVVASLLPVPFILLSPDGTLLWMVVAISVTMAIQVISGSVVEPKVMGHTSDLHPVVILLALMFWGMMWGVTGMFLATPITAGIKIVLEGYEGTKPIAGVLAGRFEELERPETYA